MVEINYTKYTSVELLSKSYSLNGTTLVKTPNCLKKGKAEKITCTFQQFKKHLQEASPSVAFGYGTHETDCVDIVIRVKEDLQKKKYAKTKDHFLFRKEPGIAFLDHDTSLYGAAVNAEELEKIIIDICPALQNVPIISRASVSSGVSKIGESPKNSGGLHLYIPVFDASDIPRFTEALFERLWLKGHGYIALAANGSLLIRSLIDLSVSQGQGLDYVGSPSVGEGLVYKAPDIVLSSSNSDEKLLNTKFLKSLSQDERRKLNTLQCSAKNEIESESNSKKLEWQERAIVAQMKKGVSEQDARANVDNVDQDLYDSYLITFADPKLGTVSIKDILADPNRYDGQACADPIEGTAYGQTTAKFYNNGHKKLINSFAHGGKRYYLHNSVELPVSSSLTTPTFDRTKDGLIKSGVRNLEKGLTASHLTGYLLGYDQFTDLIMFQRNNGGWQPFTDEVYTELRICLSDQGFAEISSSNIREVVHLVARKNKFDSARLWLKGLAWDGNKRVDHFAAKYLGANISDYATAVSRYLWSALAGRTLEPGIKVDQVPTLIGPQGARKSTAVSAIVKSHEYYAEISFNDEEDKTARKIKGVQVCEISELRGINTRDAESIKALLSRTHDKLIPKFKECAVIIPRRCVFIGTTNQNEFLGDPTGARRWLPLSVGLCDPDSIELDRDQLWAEGAVLFKKSGVAWELAENLARNVHCEHELYDEWLDVIGAHLAKAPFYKSFPLHEIAEYALDIKKASLTRPVELRIANVLRKLGFTKERKMIDKVRQHRWVKTEELP